MMAKSFSDKEIAALREKYGERNVDEKGKWTGGEGRRYGSAYMVLPSEFGGEPGAFEKALKEEQSKKEKVATLKDEASTKNRLAFPQANVIERSDAEGNPAKKAPARPMRGGIGGGGMNPADIEKVPGKRLLKMKQGGIVKSSASKRADGCATKGKTRGRMV